MMLDSAQIYRQIHTLTADLVRLSLCDRQNFPCIRELRQGSIEVTIQNKGNLSYALKNVPYRDIYAELERAHAYNVRMLDGALIQMMYRFRSNQIISHRLAFFPSPVLEEFQNSPEVYLQNEIYAEVIMKNVVPFPIRFDFDGREEVVAEINHPKSHLTLGQYQNCRIPVSAPLTPYYFVAFIMRNFYNTAYRKYCVQLSAFTNCFEKSITDRERELLYIEIPAG